MILVYFFRGLTSTIKILSVNKYLQPTDLSGETPIKIHRNIKIFTAALTIRTCVSKLENNFRVHQCAAGLRNYIRH